MAEQSKVALAQEYITKAIQLIGLTACFELFDKEMNQVIISRAKTFIGW